jgi:mannan endo-1,4-beta-mannosidase
VGRCGLALAVCLATLSPAPLSAHPAGIETPKELVAYLRSIEGRHTISGQYVGEGDLKPIEDIHASCGRWLGLISGDYYLYDQTGGIPNTAFNRSAVAYWNAGGLIVLNLHMSNPTTGGPVYDTSRLDAAGLLTPGTPTHEAFMRSLSGVARGLRELRDAGVVVIFRPFHENGGDWFWWGKSRQSPAQMVALWRFTHDYMEKTEGLHNLVWLFESGQPDVPTLSNYPGDAYVDMIGQDVYTDYPGDAAVVDAYRTMLSTGKLVCMAEFGPRGPNGGDLGFNETELVSALRGRMPRTVLFVQWWDLNAGRTGWGMASTRDAAAALNDPWILDRDHLGFPK